MPVDAYTIGSSPAAVNLMQILQEIGDEGLQSAVTTFIRLVSEDLKNLRPMTDDETYKRVAGLILKDAEERMPRAWPEKVKTHTNTVLHTRRGMYARLRMFHATYE